MKNINFKPLFASVAILGAAFAPLAASADTIPFQQTGTLKVIFEGQPADQGGFTLDQQPSFDFGMTQLTKTSNQAGSYTLNGRSTDKFSITDGRGGDTGYSITAEASKLATEWDDAKFGSAVKSGAYVIEPSSITLNTANTSHVKEVNANTEIYNTANKVLVGDKDSNGTLTAGETTATMVVPQQGIKAKEYTGFIQYTLMEQM
ncbi:MAG: WxL domain-containing protein [Lactobacillales bacterium]|jgi:hypothetical protein|nr:WxL domain-containing protein [Lactobacillales bacterium]